MSRGVAFRREFGMNFVFMLVLVVIVVPLVAGLSDNVLKNINANLVRTAARKAGFSDAGKQQMLGLTEKVRLRASDELSEAAASERLDQACEQFKKDGPSDDGGKLPAFRDAYKVELREALKNLGR